MMKSYSRILRIMASLLSVAALGNDASGQDENVEELKIPPRPAWIIQTSVPKDLDNPVKVMLGEDIQLVTLSNRVSAGPIPIPENGLIRLVKEIPNPNDKGKITYRTLAQAVVGEGITSALIIMSPVIKPEEGGPVFMTRVQSLTEFKGGDFLYMNMTNASIGVEIGDSKLTLKPGSMKIQGVNGGDKLASVPYRYSYYDEAKQRWLPLDASMTIFSPKRREVFIFSVSEGTGRIRCKGVTVPVI